MTGEQFRDFRVYRDKTFVTVFCGAVGTAAPDVYHHELTILYYDVLATKLFRFADSQSSVSHECECDLLLGSSYIYQRVDLVGGEAGLRLGFCLGETCGFQIVLVE